MVRQKYDDTVTEKFVSSGKVFMYKSPEWEILFPIVDIIRLFKKNTILSYKIGKGQNIFRTYGSGYNHTFLGNDLKKKDDYLFALRMVQCVFLFSDASDPIVTSLINLSKKNEIPYVCYSTLDSKYHFFYNTEHKLFEKPEDVINHMYFLFDLGVIKKLATLFPDFEIIDAEDLKQNTTLEECQRILKETTISEKKKKDLNNVQLFDPHLSRLRKMERDRVKVDYPDDPKPPGNNFLSKFFKKINK